MERVGCLVVCSGLRSQYVKEGQYPFTGKRGIPMLPVRLRVGFVTVLSCLALLLGLFASSGTVSAHSVQALHTQTSVSSASTDQRCFRVRERSFRFFFGSRHQRFRREEDFFRLRCPPVRHRFGGGMGGGMGGGY